MAFQHRRERQGFDKRAAPEETVPLNAAAETDDDEESGLEGESGSASESSEAGQADMSDGDAPRDLEAPDMEEGTAAASSCGHNTAREDVDRALEPLAAPDDPAIALP